MNTVEERIEETNRRSRTLVGRSIRGFKNNSLLKNSINLMLSAGVTALFGFVFWTIVARTFKPSTVGLATTLLSMSSLISLLGLVGFDTIFVRFLPKSTRRSDEINNGMIVSGIASGITALIFCAIIPIISPKLHFVDSHIAFILAFMVVSIFTTWNTLTNAALIAYRKTSLVVIINILFSALKMCLPFVIHSGGPMTIFAFTGAAQVINVILSVAALMLYFDYKPALKLNLGILKEMRKYGTAVYIGQILNLLPDSFLPLIVVNELGPVAAAYFYIAITIANLLYTVSFSTAQALLAEASYDERHVLQHLKRGLKFSSAILVPMIIIVIVFCPLILSLFGHGYRVGSVGVLRLLSIAGFGVMIGALINFVFKQTKHLTAMLTTTGVNSIATVALSFILVKHYGLDGIGWAFILGGCASLITGAYFLMKEF
jgi:O-antigen/teichoic acid export membrane protein